MVFSSIIFLFIFLPLVLAAYFLVPKPWKNAVLLICSLFFYAWGEPVYVLLMMLSVGFNYVMGLDIARQQAAKRRRSAQFNLLLTVVVNLFLLGFFKYSGFLIDTLNAVFSLHLTYKQLALPIGISFYTFQTLSYILDVYWGKVEVQRNLLHFGLYVTMFPQLIAGPIVRYADIAPQLKERRVTLAGFGAGAQHFIWGLAKKVLLANNLGRIYAGVQAMDLGGMSVLTAWLGILAYTLQIYFDFSGYSDMAIGLGKMFGFTFMKNFDHPYISKTITEFWRRWHISLGTWFREYVYIPLGGNRVVVAKHIRNILVVWMLTGLWHGASWNFVVWGLYYGVLLLLEKYVLAPALTRAPRWVAGCYTMLLVMIGWVFFSNTSITSAFAYLGALFGFFRHSFLDTAGLYLLKSNAILLALGILACGPRLAGWMRGLAKGAPWVGVAVNVCLLLLCIAFLVFDTYNPFLYFRF